MIFMTLASSYTVLAVGILRRQRFCSQLVCLWIDFDHSKFEPHSVSHRGAVRRAHRRHRRVSFANNISLVM